MRQLGKEESGMISFLLGQWADRIYREKLPELWGTMQAYQPWSSFNLFMSLDL